MGKTAISGLDMTLKVRETICISLDPVVVEIFLGLILTSYKMAFCSQGTKK